jgi:hypothetical protein
MVQGHSEAIMVVMTQDGCSHVKLNPYTNGEKSFSPKKGMGKKDLCYLEVWGES